MQRIVPYSSTLDKVVGYGFRPTDEELVDHYLKGKLQGDDVRVDLMPEIDLCDVEPWEVPVMLEKSVIRFNGRKWFFFSRVDYKYRNSKRFNRKTKGGYWKTTGKERKVMNTKTKTVIGTKKTLVYYKGRFPDGVKSNWVIHEYHDATFHENQRAFVVCCLIQKTDERGTDALICDEEEPSRGGVSDYANQDGTSTEIGTTFQEVHQAEICFSPIQQSPTGIQTEEASSPNSPLCDAYFRNENNVMQTPFKTMQDDKCVMQTPFETMQTPFETMYYDKCVMQTPFETMQTPFETMYYDKCLMQAPYEITQTPFETMYYDKSIMQTPFEDSAIYEDSAI